MAVINTDKLEVTNLDFHGIKDSLKTFLQSQSEFNDYDFDGSGLGVLLDLQNLGCILLFHQPQSLCLSYIERVWYVVKSQSKEWNYE